jgi:hypothetical protein
MDPHLSLSCKHCACTIEDFAFMKSKPFCEALSALMYASVVSWPDITYAIGQLARYQDSPRLTHWNVLKHVYQYLKGMLDLELVLSSQDDNDAPIGYSDADGMSTEGRHTMSGYVFTIGTGAVSWSSKHQDLVMLSTTKAEYVTQMHAVKEAIWLCLFVANVFGPCTNSILLRSDNQSAITLTCDDCFHARTKHINIRFHFIWYVIADSHIHLKYCPTEDMVADVLMKALPSLKAKHFAMLMGLRQHA